MIAPPLWPGLTFLGPVMMIRRAIGERRVRPRLTPVPERRGQREAARRCRQIAGGRLKHANGLAAAVTKE